jgi:hypothetical protein
VAQIDYGTQHEGLFDTAHSLAAKRPLHCTGVAAFPEVDAAAEPVGILFRGFEVAHPARQNGFADVLVATMKAQDQTWLELVDARLAGHAAAGAR